MTREEKIDAFAMRLDGYTLQAIADKYGVTRERIRKMLVNCVKPNKARQDYGYVNLKLWMKKNHISLSRLGEMLGVNYGVISYKMNGRGSFELSQINKILEITGMTYEEAFKFVEKEDNH